MVPLMKEAFLQEKKVRKELAKFILSGERLSMGGKCREFEEVFAAWQGRKHCVLVNSGASANLILIQSLLNMGRLQKGDRVGVSAVTWATNVMPLVQLGLIPVPIDVDPATLDLDCVDLSSRLMCHLDALFVTNLLGFCDSLPAVKKLCREWDVLLLEDNCESLGTVAAGRRSGNFGHSATFSFYVAHHLSTIEGGCVVTDDGDLADMLTMVRANGWDRNLPEDKQAEIRAAHAVDGFQAAYTFYASGYNVRPTEITGVLGLEGMKRLDASLESRRAQYRRALGWIKEGGRAAPEADVPAFATPVICRDAQDRDALVSRANRLGIETRPLVGRNITRQPFWQDDVGPPQSLPGADLLSDNALYVANFPFMSAKESGDLKRLLQSP